MIRLKQLLPSPKAAHATEGWEKLRHYLNLSFIINEEKQKVGTFKMKKYLLLLFLLCFLVYLTMAFTEGGVQISHAGGVGTFWF